MANIGSVTITVEADASNIPADVEKAAKSLSGVGDRLGAIISKGLAQGLNASVGSAVDGVKTQLVSGLTAAGDRAGSALAAAFGPRVAASLTSLTSSLTTAEGRANLLGATGSRVGSALMTALGPSISGVIGRFGDGFRDAQLAASSFSGVAGTLGGLVSGSMNLAKSAVTGFAGIAKGAFNGLVSVTQAVWDKIKSSAAAAFSAIGKTMGDTLSAAGKLAGAAVAATVGTALVKGFSRLTSIDTATNKLLALGNSAGDVQVMMDKATASVRGTAFGLGEAANAAAGLAAAKVPLGQMDAALSAMTSTASLANVGLDDMSSIFNKVAANGKLTGETMAQLLDRQVPVLAQIQDEYGVTAEAAREMVSKGEITFDKFVGLMGQNGDAAKIMGQSFTGMSANVGAALGRLGASAIKPFFDGLKPVMAALIGTADSMGAIDRVGKILAPTFEAIGNAVAPMAEKLAAMLAGFGAAETSVGNFLPALAPLVPLLGLAAGALGPLMSSLPLIGPLFAGITGPVGLLAGGLIALLAFKPETLINGFDSLAGSLPGMITGVVGMISTMVPKMVERIATNLPIFVTGILNLITAVIPAIAAAIPTIVTAVAGLIPMLITTLLAAIPMLLTAALQLFNAIVQAIPPIIPVLLTAVIGMIPVIITALLTALPQIITAALELFMGLVMGLVEAIPAVVDAIISAIPVFIETLVGMIPDLISGALELFLGIVTGLAEAIPEIITAIVNMIPVLVTSLVSQLPAIINGAIDLFLGIVLGLLDATPQIVTAVIDMIPKIIEALIGAVPLLLQAGIDLIGGLLKGLWEAGPKIGQALLDIAKGAIDGFLSFLGINSPSKLFAGFGKNTMDGYIQGVEKMASGVEDALTDTIKPFSSSVNVTGTPTISPTGGYRPPPPPAAAASSGITFEDGAIRVEGAGDPDRAARGVVDRIAEEVAA